MSTSAKKQRQKKAEVVERIIPVRLENDLENDDGNKSSSSETTSTLVIDKDLQNSSTSTDVSGENNVSFSMEKLDISEDTDSIATENDEAVKIQERILPPYNVPERIIIVLDRAEDEISTCFKLSNGNELKPLDMLKDSLKFLLNGKSTIDSKHEFALMTLNENSATWVHDFTNNIHSINKALDEIDECETEDIFDMTAVFNLINQKVAVPLPKSDLMIPPPFVVRTIFLYNRSITMPEVKLNDEIRTLLDSPYFTFDVAMTHEIPDSSNRCNLIFKELQRYDKKGYAYFFPVSRSASLLCVAMAKLLSHPLQRCAQRDANYKLICT